MKIVSTRDKEFKIIPEKKKVIGTMPIKWIEKDIHNVNSTQRSIISMGMSVLFPDILDWLSFWGLCEYKITATAVCDKRDEFDESKGIDICSAKLELKNHLKLAKAYDRLNRVLIETSNVVSRLCMKHALKADAIKQDLKRTYGAGGEED